MKQHVSSASEVGSSEEQIQVDLTIYTSISMSVGAILTSIALYNDDWEPPVGSPEPILAGPWGRSFERENVFVCVYYDRECCC